MPNRPRRYVADDPSQGAYNQISPFQDQSLDPIERPGGRQPTDEPYSVPTSATGGIPRPYTGQAGYDPNALVAGYARRGTSKRGPIGSLIGSAAGGVGGGALLGGKLGAFGGPIGAAAGSLVGAVAGGLAGGRQAATAGTDFRVEDARDAIIQGYQQLFNRTPSQTEVDGHLQNVGWRPGHRFVGEQGLGFILHNLSSGAQGPDQQALNGPQAQASPAAATSPSTTSTPSSGAGPTGTLLGYDAGKLANPDHKTMKYQVGRILQQYPNTPAGLQAALPAIQALYPGVTLDGNDSLNFGGALSEPGGDPVGIIDVLQGADAGGQGWQWLDDSATGAPTSGGRAGGLGGSSAGLSGLTGGYNYETLIQEILKDALGGRR